MKKLHILSYAALAAVALGFSACEEELSGPQINVSQPTAPVVTFSAANTSFVLERDSADAEFQKITWSAASFAGAALPFQYKVEMDASGSDFNDAIPVGTTGALELSLKQGAINSALLGAGKAFGEAHAVNFRVVASVLSSSGTANIEAIPSAHKTLTITPFDETPPPPPAMGLVGPISKGWDVGADDVRMSETSAKKWFVKTYLNAGQGKFRFDKKWDLNYGADSDNNPEKALSGSARKDGQNIELAEAGYYDVTLDENALTYSFVKLASKPTFDAIGIVGAFSDWGGKPDVAMTKDAFDPYLWTATGVVLPAGPVKFRANSDWANNWGYNATLGGGNVTITDDGGNINLGAGGTFDVTVNIYTGAYTFTKK